MTNRTVTIVVGGQYGSEGKGKITSYLATQDNPAYVVRSGGPNAGHCVWVKGKKIPFKQIPVGILNPDTKLRIAAGSLINLNILNKELSQIELAEGALGIDGKAYILTPEIIQKETDMQLRDRLSSTLSGTGAGTAARVMRDPGGILAKDEPTLAGFIVDVAKEVNEAIDAGQGVVIEGTQGFGLSLYHSEHYPCATSRDTTAAAFISECGISPMAVKDVVLVVRTYPIRVAGVQAGPLENETTWEEVQRKSGCPDPFVEMTSVSKRVRRVGTFDIELVKQAIMYNRPTMLAVHGMDYINYKDTGARDFESLSCESKDFLAMLWHETGVPIKFIFTGQANEDIIDLR